ncbi:uncharacterized protein LOC132339581 [Haemorhous mexicanus]|uniref:uncharacterized protein LOC132339581 n=1 Tax=Haemorhous mexicanus TaxID=30427 RepID=UPI0028BE0A20|nr:uncharacterized protein LOC132339581 [Haemorhous mexicanus]
MLQVQLPNQGVSLQAWFWLEMGKVAQNNHLEDGNGRWAAGAALGLQWMSGSLEFEGKKKHPNLIIIMIIIIITVLSRAWVLSRPRCYETKISFVAVRKKEWKQSREGGVEAVQDLMLQRRIWSRSCLCSVFAPCFGTVFGRIQGFRVHQAQGSLLLPGWWWEQQEDQGTREQQLMLGHLPSAKIPHSQPKPSLEPPKPGGKPDSMQWCVKTRRNSLNPSFFVFFLFLISPCWQCSSSPCVEGMSPICLPLLLLGFFGNSWDLQPPNSPMGRAGALWCGWPKGWILLPCLCQGSSSPWSSSSCPGAILLPAGPGNVVSMKG